MLPEHRPPTAPGQMLQHFLNEMELTQTELASAMNWTKARVNELVKGKRSITPETALCLADAFGNSPEFWLNGQRNWDLWHARQKHIKRRALITLTAERIAQEKKKARQKDDTEAIKVRINSKTTVTKKSMPEKKPVSAKTRSTRTV